MAQRHFNLPEYLERRTEMNSNALIRKLVNAPISEQAKRRRNARWELQDRRELKEAMQ